MSHIKLLLKLSIVAGIFFVFAPAEIKPVYATESTTECPCGGIRVCDPCPEPDPEPGGGEAPEMPVALVPAFLLAGIWAARSAKKRRKK